MVPFVATRTNSTCYLLSIYLINNCYMFWACLLLIIRKYYSIYTALDIHVMLKLMEFFKITVVPPCGLPRPEENWKFKETTVHKFQNVRHERTGRNTVKSSSPNAPSTWLIFLCPPTHASLQNLPHLTLPSYSRFPAELDSSSFAPYSRFPAELDSSSFAPLLALPCRTCLIFLCPPTHASPQNLIYLPLPPYSRFTIDLASFSFVPILMPPRRTCRHSAFTVLAVRISCRVIALFVFRKHLFIN
jgi:hypothetical protein